MLQLSSRMEACGQSPRRFRLRMGRRDIASHLGVAHETVSRSFQALARWSLLSVSNREVEILDMDGLKTLAHCTRRHLDDADTAPGRNHQAAPQRVGHAAVDLAA
jgi:CRP/FNR family transcriptional regulator